MKATGASAPPPQGLSAGPGHPALQGALGGSRGWMCRAQRTDTSESWEDRTCILGNNVVGSFTVRWFVPKMLPVFYLPPLLVD